MTQTPSIPRPGSILGKSLNDHMRTDKLVLQVCEPCGAVQYPPREICRNCLSDELRWKETDNNGRIIAVSTLNHSFEPFFQDKLPLTIASVRLKNDVTLFAFCDAKSLRGQRVIIVGENSSSRFGFKAIAASGEDAP